MLKGDLVSSPLAPLLIDLADDAATGCLHIVDPDGEVALVYLKNGLVYSVSVPGTRPQLGAKLVSSGALAPEALHEALEAQRTELQGWRLGELLVHLGYVDQPVVEAFVKEQVNEALWDLLRWPDANWKFRKNIKAREDVGPPMPVVDLLEALRERGYEWESISAVVHGPNAVPMLSARGDSPAETTLDNDAWSMLCKIDGTRTVAELASDCGYTLFEAGHVIVSLVKAGLVDIAEDVDFDGDGLYGATTLTSALSGMLDSDEDSAEEDDDAFARLARLVTEVAGDHTHDDDGDDGAAEVRPPSRRADDDLISTFPVNRTIDRRSQESFAAAIARVSGALSDVLGASPAAVEEDSNRRRSGGQTVDDPEWQRRKRLRSAAAAELVNAQALIESLRPGSDPNRGKDLPSDEIPKIVSHETEVRRQAEREAEAARVAAEEEAARIAAEEEAARIAAEEAAEAARIAADEEAARVAAEEEAARIAAEEAARIAAGEAAEAARIAAEEAAEAERIAAEEEAARLAAEEEAARIAAEEAAEAERIAAEEEAARIAAEEEAARVAAEEAAEAERIAAEEEAARIAFEEAAEAERQAEEAAEAERIAAEEEAARIAAEEEAARIAAEEEAARIAAEEEAARIAFEEAAEEEAARIAFEEAAEAERQAEEAAEAERIAAEEEAARIAAEEEAARIAFEEAAEAERQAEEAAEAEREAAALEKAERSAKRKAEKKAAEEKDHEADEAALASALLIELNADSSTELTTPAADIGEDSNDVPLAEVIAQQFVPEGEAFSERSDDAAAAAAMLAQFAATAADASEAVDEQVEEPAPAIQAEPEHAWSGSYTDTSDTSNSTDTAALLRELSSLGNEEDRDSTPPPPPRSPRPARPAEADKKAKKKIGLFGL